MNTYLKKFLVAVALFAFSAVVNAASWGSGFGIPNYTDDWLISGKGVNLSVIGSVRTNTQYFVTSGRASGAPRLSELFIASDLTGATIDYWLPTNSWTIASNGVIATNILWLASTNSGLATNDVLLLQSAATDDYQMLILGGGATDNQGLVYTNSTPGQVGIKIWNNTSNAPAAGDVLYKLAKIASIPVQSAWITNGLAVSPWVDTLRVPLQLQGRIGLPSLTTLTYSNAGSISLIRGDYYVRQRR